MAGVTLEKVTKRFGINPVVNNISLDIKQGEFLVLLGPSGCGKTTTLRMIAGLEQLSEGEIYFDDLPVSDVPPDCRDVAMVFQNLALYPHMTVFENVAFCLKNRKKDESFIRNKVEDALAKVGIDDLAGRKPSQLSGGQRQRVALSRAIVREPKVFLLDEPLSSLDAKIRTTMRTELKQLHQNLQATFVYVTHDQIEAMSLGTRVAVMNNGIIEQIAPPQKLYLEPSNMFVASFIGTPSINYISGLINKESLKFVSSYFEYEIPKEVINNFSENQKVTLGIRPEHIKIGKNDTGIPVNIINYEPLGQHNQINLKIGDEMWAALTDICFIPETTEEYFINLPFDRLHFFDDKSNRINIPVRRTVNG